MGRRRKTSLLASMMKLNFADTDAEIQRRTGVDIATIFEFEGEEGFRKREANVIDAMTEQDQHLKSRCTGLQNNA